MDSAKIQLVRDITHIVHEDYNNAIDLYIAHISKLPFVKSVYQIGSFRNPGISDLDMIVVVDECYDPLKIGQLSIFRNNINSQSKNIFIHDIYLYDQQTFKKILYSNYCDNIKLLYGIEQQLDIPDRLELNILSVQIIFDFVASRLAQFNQFIESGRIGLRGILVRTSSIKHSYSLLSRLGINDSEIEDFICNVERMRKEHDRLCDNDILEMFLDSFYFFSRIVHLASRYFFEKYLKFHTDIDASNSLKLNNQFIIKFVEDAPEHYKEVKAEQNIYYPQKVFYHYLAYIESNGIFAKRARNHLCFSGDEHYDIHKDYILTLNKRLESLSDHQLFLDVTKADFSMGGYPGFSISKDITQRSEIFKNHSSVPYVNNVSSPISSKHNLIIDKIVRFEPLDKIKSSCDLIVDRLDFDKTLYEQWVLSYFPEWQRRYGNILEKKIIELFVTYQILDLQEDDEYMDAAGGINTYVDRIKCKKKYLQGITVSSELESALGNGINYLPGDAAKIDLPDESLTKISSHHSFEHFQGNSDSDFINEVQRLLKVGGKCCIIPIFIADKYVEVSRSNKHQYHYDANSTYIIDPTAKITGGATCGDYARIYDNSSFNKRVVDQIDREKFNISLSEIAIDGNTVPDFNLQCHEGITRINYPYRALTLERIH